MNGLPVSTLCCALLLTAWPIELLAQPPNVTFEHLSVRDGLPGTAVYSIAKDRQGFMWFGTRRCPTRYDGTAFRSFLFPETYLITGLAADSTNRMWVATDRRGLCRIDPDGLTLRPIPHTPQSTGHFFIDSRGEGWFSHNEGVGRINLRTGQVRLYRFRQTNYFGLKASGFLEDRQHRLWVIGSDNGLFRLDRRTDRFTCVLGVDAAPNVTTNVTTNVPDLARRKLVYLSQGCVGSDGLLWIAAFGKGLLRYNPDTDEATYLPTSTPANDILCVQEGCDETGKRLLWVGDSQGLLVFRPEQGRFFRVAGIRPTPFMTYCLYRDPVSGILWAGTSDGVLTYNPQDNRIRTVSLPPALVPQPVTIKAIRADRTDTTGNTFWLGLSHTGFVRWHRPTNRFALIRYPHAASEARWFGQTNDGRLWIGLRRMDERGEGVLVFDPARLRYVPNPAAWQATRLFGLPYVDQGLIDHQQRLWVGNTDLGARVLDSRTGQVLRYWPDSATKALHRNTNFLTDIAIAPTGQVWLATYNGLYTVRPSPPWFVNMDRLNPQSKQPEDPTANSLLIARNGHIWAARWGSVTESSPDGTLLRVLTARDGLFDRENRHLAEDQNGTIWIGNFEGLHAYNPRTRKLWRLTVSDGLCQNNTLNALYIHRGTDLLVGQTNGINVLDVRQMARPRPSLPVVVSAFRVHDQDRTVDLAKPIHLARTDNAFSVDFTVLAYSRLPTVQYAYRLDGLDDHWRLSGTSHSPSHRATYTNLGPGTYTLHLNATNSVGQWNPKPTRLSIIVLPAYYETGWFRLLVAVLLLGTLYGLYRYRINQLLRVQRIRNRISADLHDEIGSSLSSISILGSLANQSLPSGHPTGVMVAQLVSEARQVSGSLDDIVWSINPKNDALGSLLARMNRYAAELFEASGIRYELELPPNLGDLTLPMEQRQDFYLIVKEAINNVIKHAQATRVQVAIRLTNQQMQLQITDDGVGFDASQATERNGLRNMHTRARRLNGHLTIRAAPQQGTTLDLRFPVLHKSS